MSKRLTALRLVAISVLLGTVLTIAACATREGESDGKTSKAADSVAKTSSDEASRRSRFPDGTYAATVDYYNPATAYSATYRLDVDVENGEVVKIHFANGGYLDEDHISPAGLDENGDAEVEGEDGKTYSVHIDPPTGADDPDESEDSDSE